MSAPPSPSVTSSQGSQTPSPPPVHAASTSSTTAPTDQLSLVQQQLVDANEKIDKLTRELDYLRSTGILLHDEFTADDGWKQAMAAEDQAKKDKNWDEVKRQAKKRINRELALAESRIPPPLPDPGADFIKTKVKELLKDATSSAIVQMHRNQILHRCISEPTFHSYFLRGVESASKDSPLIGDLFKEWSPTLMTSADVVLTVSLRGTLIQRLVVVELKWAGPTAWEADAAKADPDEYPVWCIPTEKKNPEKYTQLHPIARTHDKAKKFTRKELAKSAQDQAKVYARHLDYKPTRHDVPSVADGIMCFGIAGFAGTITDDSHASSLYSFK